MKRGIRKENNTTKTGRMLRNTVTRMSVKNKEKIRNNIAGARLSEEDVTDDIIRIGKKLKNDIRFKNYILYMYVKTPKTTQY